MATLKSLKQGAAAHVLNVSVRTLRDRVEIPRDADGCFDIDDLVRYATKAVPRPDLSDHDLEKIQTVVDAIYAVVEAEAGAICDLFGGLQERFGDGALLVFLDALEGAFRDYLRDYPPDNSPWTDADSIEAANEAKRRHEEARARDQLQVATTCEDCNSLRRGPSWVKESPPVGYLVVKGCCPSSD